jgi:aconitate hydratase
MFVSRYGDVYTGDERWRAIEITGGETYSWPAHSTYIQNPPYFTGMTMTPVPPGDIERARVLAMFGDSITTDHISPAGAIKPDSPAGRFLLEHQVSRAEFNSYGARRGNHDVMMRGTFANIRIRNRMLDDVEGGFTRYLPTGETQAIYDAAMAYKAAGTPLVVLAGKEYGTGSSRDWAAKGTVLLGVRAVIAESFERIHRSNLVGMGVLPLQFRDGESAASHGLDGSETYSIRDVAGIEPRQDVEVEVMDAQGATTTFTARCRIDTYNELEYFHAGGILPYVLRRLAACSSSRCCPPARCDRW